MKPLVYRVEDQFIAEGHKRCLREMHDRGDFNGVLEYAVLLADQDATSRSKIAWLTQEVVSTLQSHP
jgi:hypothetical protein